MSPIVRNGPWLESLSLKHGSHRDQQEFCVMEAVAYVAGEPWSDAPRCACPVITRFLVTWNDSLPSDADRDRILKPLIPLVVDTRSTPKVERQRGWMAFDWLVREYAAAWMDLTPSLVPHAAALRALPEVTVDSINLCMPVLGAARQASAAARDAAWAADRAAARDAAWAADRAAVRDAAWAAAGAAASDAAWAAASDAAWAAAGDAAGAAAWAAAGAALPPTTARLQASAMELVKRMCAVQEEK